MTDFLSFGQQILDSQPFSRLLNAQLNDFGEGFAEIVIPVEPQLLQQHGFVHGGVLSYAADNALTFAGGSVLGPSVVTSEYKINYLKPAQGERLVARAKVIGSGSRQAVCHCNVFVINDQTEVLCAVAQGTIVNMSKTESTA